MVKLPFQDRREAGRALIEALPAEWRDPSAIVLALPRGGVPVAFELARSLGCGLDVFPVRKLGVPGYPELAMGAIATGGITVLNPDVIASLNIPQAAVDAVTARETAELERSAAAYRGSRPPIALQDRPVILVDDGLATGATMRAAARAARMASPLRLAIAVPVAAAESLRELQEEGEAVFCLATPHAFYAVGAWYRDFRAVSDEEVRRLIESVRATDPGVGSNAESATDRRSARP